MDLWWVFVALGIVTMIYAKLGMQHKSQRASEASREQQLLHEMEEAITAFVAEIQEENDQVVDRMRLMKEHTDAKIKKLEKLETTMETRVQQLEKELEDAKKNMSKQVRTSTVTSMQKRQPLNIRERYRKVFQLYDQKNSLDEIAKRTGLNKGEIQLVVQLADREAKLNVE